MKTVIGAEALSMQCLELQCVENNQENNAKKNNEQKSFPRSDNLALVYALRDPVRTTHHVSRA